MKVPLSWLREFVDVDLPVSDLAHRLTMAGLEVEDVHLVGSDWHQVTIARVTDLERHPRADSLVIARLDAGDRSHTVVTAAPNLHVGALVPHVGPGGRLPAGEVGSRTFQGVVSEGMLCSGEELGVSPDKDGIYLLEQDAPVGQPLAEYLDEVVLDLYITANRPDCMSVVGIAREVHALTGGAFRPPTARPPEGPTPARDLVSVQIDDPIGCPRFTAAVVEGVAIKPSPLWVQRRLYFSGVRPISNVVDVTNYVMLEVGQPLHAFDRQRLHDGIVVRRARSGERLITLDGVDRVLSDDMMVVADASGARSLAGIMGGHDSEIVDYTREVVLEGASWDRASIRLTSSALNLSSEAARRFGRGIDPDLTELAVSRAAAMTVELAGGQAGDGLVDEYPGREEPRTIEVRPEQIDGLLGAQYPRERIVGSLEALGFDVEERGDTLNVTVPGWRRFDVERRADLAEEVARIVGYEHVPATALAGPLPEPRPEGDAGFADELRARRTLAAAGLQEVITYSLVEPGLAARLDPGQPWPAEITPGPLTIANPQSVDQSVLRPSLLGSLLGVLRANLRHRERVLLFELARTWRGTLDPLPDERRHVGIVATGPRWAPGWDTPPERLDFFDVKGVVDALCQAFGVQPSYRPAARPSFHPGRSAEVVAGEVPLGTLGEVHPLVAERFDLEGKAVIAAEIDFEALLACRRPVEKAQTPSRFPPADRDIAIVVDEALPQADAERVIHGEGAPLLESLRLFDVYRGDPIPAGRKSLAYALRYQAPDRTLSDEEVAQAHTRVEEALRRQCAAEIRGR